MAINALLRRDIKAYLTSKGPSELVPLTWHVLLKGNARNGGNVMEEVQRMVQFNHLHVNSQGLITDGPTPKLTAMVVKGVEDA